MSKSSIESSMNRGLGITKEGVELQTIIFEGKIYEPSLSYNLAKLPHRCSYGSSKCIAVNVSWSISTVILC